LQPAKIEVGTLGFRLRIMLEFPVEMGTLDIAVG
jgi:hypothetical protein